VSASGRFGVGVLASGSGTNLQAIIDRVHGQDGIDVAGVASDQPGARALERAAAAGIATQTFALAEHPDRVARDTAIADWLQAQGVELVVLAGYMALLTPGFLARFPLRVINVHPALLPAFPGLDAVGQALAYGVKLAGVTVHFVDEGVDSGPIILQESIEVPPGANGDSLHAALQPLEHELLPRAVRLIAAGRVSIDPADPRRVVIA
jgi:phosphoribosylglycinamide formyltransferase-1